MIPAEILKKVKLLEIGTRKLVNNLFAGEYHTHFKGQGMTFSDFREYVPGDDVRNISWALTARTGKPYIKKFEEERELTIILAIDVSGSTDYGSSHYFKGEVMIHLAALLAFAAQKNNDQVGLLLFSDQVEHFVPPKKGRGHIHRILRDLYYYQPKSHTTKMSSAIEFLLGFQKKRASIFIMSDFIDQSFQKPLRQLGLKHDVVACVVQDKTELRLPDFGYIDVQDPESGEIFAVDTSDSIVRKTYEMEMDRLKKSRDKALRSSQVDLIDIDPAGDYVGALTQYFRIRK